MKKALALIAASLIFAATFNGCNQEKTETVATENTTQSVTEVTEVTEAAAEVVTEAEMQTEVQQNDDWATAYKEYLLDVCEENNRKEYPDTMKFEFRYIDDDEIPELFVNDGDFHAAGVRVITFWDGKLIESDRIGAWGQLMYVEEENKIIASNTAMGMVYVEVYHIEKGVLVLDWRGEEIPENMDVNSRISYTSDGKEVSKEQYEKEYEKFVPKWFDSDLESPEEMYVFDDRAISVEKGEIESVFEELKEELMFSQDFASIEEFAEWLG